MQIAILVFDRFTALDAVGPYEVLSRLPGAEVVFTAESRGPVRAETGSLALVADAALDEVPRPDVVVVAGGPGQGACMAPGPVLSWLRAVDATSAHTTSVCTGSLLLAAAGLLVGRRATTHWLAIDQLADLGAIPVHERFVADGKYLTAAGVSAGMDMALSLADRIAGEQVARTIQLGLEYAPQPPHGVAPGCAATAAPAIVEGLRARRRQILT
ncbi:glutamine amidotransferase [Wenjunlia vitaminophila]|uniref:Glutamine amidotransferase n=1 Tax=Wenjunlia vitaminophila TaxID=76728 RepID=A0A0T6LWS2_WENVI|nr:DJ-1/PfpI family protein [Wenjunlia vitaminophila]KRV50558.1 glutamine amidotransferase [Wenjunlia vitaminophila]